MRVFFLFLQDTVVFLSLRAPIHTKSNPDERTALTLNLVPFLSRSPFSPSTHSSHAFASVKSCPNRTSLVALPLSFHSQLSSSSSLSLPNLVLNGSIQSLFYKNCSTLIRPHPNHIVYIRTDRLAINIRSAIPTYPFDTFGLHLLHNYRLSNCAFFFFLLLVR
jgi:hypothetical protein